MIRVGDILRGRKSGRLYQVVGRHNGGPTVRIKMFGSPGRQGVISCDNPRYEIVGRNYKAK